MVILRFYCNDCKKRGEITLEEVESRAIPFPFMDTYSPRDFERIEKELIEEKHAGCFSDNLWITRVDPRKDETWTF